MNKSHAYIEESALIDWRTRMNSINQESITLLKSYENKVKELDEYMKGNVATGFVTDESSALRENINFHENMKDLEKFINIVIENMKEH